MCILISTLQLSSLGIYFLVFATEYMQEFKNTENEEAAVLAASKAASTVIDASNAVEVSRYVIQLLCTSI